MGCQRSKLINHENEVESTFKESHALNNSELYNLDVVSLDPDLGWRRFPTASHDNKCLYRVPVSTFHDPSEWHSKYEISGSLNPSSRTAPYPSGWNVVFINGRSGNYCETSLVTLSINIAIRAEELARTFGVVHEPVCSDGSGVQGSCLVTSKTEPSRRLIYAFLGIPDFEWVLLSRKENLALHTKIHQNTHSHHKIFSKKSKAHHTESCGQTPPHMFLQMLENHYNATSKKRVLADVASLGMNIAEQLHRLERKRNNRHLMPTETFGWRVTESDPNDSDFHVTAITPNETVISFVPEELIMNITQWVQQTYMTSALL